MTLVAVLAVCATVLVIWFTSQPLLQRLLAVMERVPERPKPPEHIAIPGDLLLWATGAGQEWAREQNTAYVRDLYAQTQDWDVVRRVVSNEQ